MKEDTHSCSTFPRGIPRRDFIKLAAAAGLLAGCNQAQKQVVAQADAAAGNLLVRALGNRW